MKRMLFVASVVLLATSFAHAGGGGKLPFTHDVAKGLANAKLSGQPAVLYFTADW